MSFTKRIPYTNTATYYVQYGTCLGVVVELVTHGVNTERVLLVTHVRLQLVLCRATILRLRSHLPTYTISLLFRSRKTKAIDWAARFMCLTNG